MITKKVVLEWSFDLKETLEGSAADVTDSGGGSSHRIALTAPTKSKRGRLEMDDREIPNTLGSLFRDDKV